MDEQKMQTIVWVCETSKVGGDFSGEFEIEDDATDEEIDQIVREEVANYVSWGWSRKGEDA